MNILSRYLILLHLFNIISFSNSSQNFDNNSFKNSNISTTTTTTAATYSSSSKHEIEINESDYSFLSLVSEDFYLFKLRAELKREICQFIATQKKIKNFNGAFYKKFDVENWPKSVPFHSNTWDQQKINDIRAALPGMIFTEKSSCEKKSSNSTYYSISAGPLIKTLTQIYRRQIGDKSPKIQWTKCHLKGWPKGVISCQSKNRVWTKTEVLEISRCLDKICFIPMLKGEIRTVTYIDGTCEIADVIDSYITGNKRKFDYINDVSASSTDLNSSSSSSSNALTIIPEPVEIFPQNQSSSCDLTSVSVDHDSIDPFSFFNEDLTEDVFEIVLRQSLAAENKTLN